MVVRGAPAIGVTAAYGVVLAALEFLKLPIKQFLEQMHSACNIINKSRPTAVNLMWAIKRMRTLLIDSDTPAEILRKLKAEADKIADEDIKTNKKMGQYGNSLIPQKATILTHCNTGALATVEYGTALGVVRAAVEAGKEIFVMRMKPDLVCREPDLLPGNWFKREFQQN